MASFSYVAMDSFGKERKGNIDAQSREQALAMLKSDKLIVSSLESAGALSKDINIGGGKPKTRDLSVFCRQFVSIIEAGVPVTAALEMLAEQTENKLLASAIAECHTSIRTGTSLSESMEQHPKVFPPLLITMVTAGEASGNLEISFSRMADQFEKDAKLQAMMKKASVYPSAIVIVAVAVITILLAFVVPQFESMLTDMGMELPWITVMVMTASDTVIQYWYVIAFVTILLFVGLGQFSKTYAGQVMLGRFQLRAPLFGILAQKTASARMCRTLATLLAAGISITDALEIVSNTMSNIHYKEAIRLSRDEVALGTPLSEPIERSGLFPPLVHHMVKIGEETGDMENMLTKLADYYDEEVEMVTQSIMIAIEPMIIIILAVVVGIIVSAVMMPMVSMYEGVGGL